MAFAVLFSCLLCISNRREYELIFIPFQSHQERSSFGSKADEVLLLRAWLYLGPCSG